MASALTGADLTLTLRGAGGEPVSLARTIFSHGLADLPPMATGPDGSWLEVTLALPTGRPRTIKIEAAGRTRARIRVLGPPPGRRVAAAIKAEASRVLRLDSDLSEFYAVAAADPDLKWAAEGAGRMIRSQSVFEDVVKTICTTNCAWSGTRRMVGALVEHLGEPAVGGRRAGRAFPTPLAIVDAGEGFLRDVARAGYRGPYLLSLARSVLDGSVDLEAWGAADPDELPDDELAERLLALPGIGPYACAHVMLMMGRYSRPIFDSWTRPTYARLVRRKKVADRTIERRFARFGRYSGLAFWLFVTRDWVEPTASA